MKTRQGKNLQSLYKELIPLPNVFVQDIPQEAETTGNVCPASSLLHAYTYIYCRQHKVVLSTCQDAFLEKKCSSITFTMTYRTKINNDCIQITVTYSKHT